MNWQEELQKRFAGRQELASSQLAIEFMATEPTSSKALEEVLNLFREEYGIEPGLLRPDDPLSIFAEPPRTGNPVTWLFNRAAVEDRVSELNHRLMQQRREISAPPLQRSPVTVREYVLAWLGSR